VIIGLDTNVFVAAMVAKGLCHEVVVRGLGSCTVATSQPLLDELEQTLREKFTLGPAGVAFLDQLRLRVQMVEPTPLASPVSRDADDDQVLAAAVAAGAALIVTGDQDLIVIGRYDGIDIVSPREFLSRLSSRFL
jgi:putative PIN family toxin of toxin-antitoxin system